MTLESLRHIVKATIKAMNNMQDKVIIATRESPLALWQANFIAQQLRSFYPNLTVDLLGMTTEGDRILDKTLSKIGGKGLFVKELEQALLEGKADLAVHSIKDVPMTLPESFTLAAITARELPFDAFVSNHYASLDRLPTGAKVGSSSLRRACQIQARYPHLTVLPLRGNVGTRLRKLDENQYDAIILAAAGLKRLGLETRIRAILSPEESLPAVGQGALGIECLANRSEMQSLLHVLNHEETAACVSAERAFSRLLGGSCQIPLGGYAIVASPEDLLLRGFVASPDGKTMLSDAIQGHQHEAEQLGMALAEKLLARGAGEIIQESIRLSAMH